jgi:hypothetical protein
MRSLQHGLGKRNLLLINFDPGASFNLGAYKAFDNKTPVTENPFVASPAAAPIGNTLDSFTSSVINPNTAYSFGNNVSLKPWDDSANAWATSGAFSTDGSSWSFDADGRLDFSGEPLNVYERANEENLQLGKLAMENDVKIKQMNAENTKGILAFLAQLLPMIGKALAGAG